jgi:hypothetical protein
LGSVNDIPIILAATLLLTITVFTGTLILQEVQAATTEATMDQSTLQDGIDALTLYDAGIVSVNAFFYLVSFIFAYRIRTSPVYAVPALISLSVSGFVSMQIANVYAAFARVGPFTSVANMFPSLNFLYNNYLSITLVMGGTLILLLYGKTRSGREVTV